jgi:hypothetical protein
MALVAAKCTQCGANIEVDAGKDAGICPHCDTAFITQKAIVNYNTTIINQNKIEAQVVNIYNVGIKKEKSIKEKTTNNKFRTINTVLNLLAICMTALLMITPAFTLVESRETNTYSNGKIQYDEYSTSGFSSFAELGSSFNYVSRTWSIIGLVLTIMLLLIGFIALIFNVRLALGKIQRNRAVHFFMVCELICVLFYMIVGLIAANIETHNYGTLVVRATTAAFYPFIFCLSIFVGYYVFLYCVKNKRAIIPR